MAYMIFINPDISHVRLALWLEDHKLLSILRFQKNKTYFSNKDLKTKVYF